MASYHLQIADDNLGTGAWTFEVNPLDFSEAFPEEAYNILPTLSGSPILQFPQVDTRLRRLAFDMIPETNSLHTDFLMGETESDTTSVLYLKNRDADGQLTIYWLQIPTDIQNLRPYGFRDTTWIPIRVEDVITRPVASPGDPRWEGEMVFRIVPLAETEAAFLLGSSTLGSDNPTATSALDGVFTYDQTGPAWVDRTAVSFTGGTPFPAFAVVAGDILYFGSAALYNGLWVDVDTFETVVPDTNQGATANLWEHWEGSWSSAASFTDGTEHFTKDERVITWPAIAAWTAIDLSSAVAGAPSTDALYWVRVTVGTITTAFKLDKTWRN